MEAKQYRGGGVNPLKGMTARPMGDDYMIDAFVGLVSYLNSDEKAMNAFHDENQHRKDELFAMNEKQAFGAFADWVAVNHWGLEGQEDEVVHL